MAASASSVRLPSAGSLSDTPGPTPVFLIAPGPTEDGDWGSAEARPSAARALLMMSESGSSSDPVAAPPCSEPARVSEPESAEHLSILDRCVELPRRLEWRDRFGELAHVVFVVGAPSPDDVGLVEVVAGVREERCPGFKKAADMIGVAMGQDDDVDHLG